MENGAQSQIMFLSGGLTLSHGSVYLGCDGLSIRFMQGRGHDQEVKGRHDRDLLLPPSKRIRLGFGEQGLREILEY